MEAPDCLAYGNGRVVFVFVAFDDIVDAEVGVVGADVGCHLRLSSVLEVLLDLLQLVPVLGQQLHHGGVVEDDHEVHHAGDYVEDDAPAVGEVLLRVYYQELLLEDEDHRE